MTATHASERALIVVRWDPSASEKSHDRIVDDVVATARQFGQDAPARLDRSSGFALIALEGASFQIATRAFAVANRLYENLITTFGEEVRIGADLRASTDGTGGSDAELERLIERGLPRHVVLGRALAERLSETDRQNLAVRDAPHGQIDYFFPAPSDTSLVGFRAPPPLLPHRFVRRGEEPPPERAIGRNGLLDPSAVPGALPLEDLLHMGRTLVVIAEPWIGKTHCARAIHRYLHRAHGPERAFLLDLRAGIHDLRFDPDWRAWLASEDEATLIVDGGDEAMFQAIDLDAALGAVRRLEDEQHARLRLLMFTRDDDASSSEVRRAVSLSRSPSGLSQPPIVRLLPLDAVEAGRELGAEGLELALERAKELGDAIPRPLSMEVLRALADPRVDPKNAMDEVVMCICFEGIPEAFRESGGKIVRVAERAAAVLQLSGTAAADLRSTGLIGPLIAGGDRAALGALLRSRALVSTGSGHRFRSRHTQELLAARVLARMPIDAKLLVRELMTDTAGRLRADLDEVATELARLDEDWKHAVGEWRSAAVPPLPEHQALDLLDAMTELSEPLLPWSQWLERLDHASVRARALGVLEDRTRPAPARELILDLAHQLRWRDPPVFAEVASAIAIDKREPARLRLRATYTVRDFGEDRLVERLRGLTTGAADSEELVRLRAVALTALLDRGLMGFLEAASLAPQEKQGLHDARSTLLHDLREHMSVDDAREVLARLAGRSKNEAPKLGEHTLIVLVHEAVRRISEDDRAWDADLARDLAVAGRQGALLGDSLPLLVEERLAEDQDARKLLYPELLDTALHYSVRNALTVEDAGWMLELARSREPLPEKLAEDLNHVLWWLEPEDPSRAAIEQLLETHSSRRWSKWEEARRRVPVRRAEREEQRRLRQEKAVRKPRHALADVIAGVRAEVTDPTQHLRGLASLCFFEGARAFTKFDGRFERLPRELRKEIVEEVRTLLPRAQPSSVPPVGESFSWHVLLDRDSFAAVVMWHDDLSWLSQQLVAGWLPLVLFGAQREDATEVVRRCFEARRDATLDVAVRAIERDARAGSYPDMAWELPPELWRAKRLVGSVLDLAQDDSLALEARAPLLRLLVARANRVEVMLTVRRLAEGDDGIALAAISILVVEGSDEGAAHVERVARDLDSAAAALRDLIAPDSDLRERRRGRDAVDGLATDSLERIARVLARVVTWIDPRPRGLSYSPTEEHELYRLRDEVMGTLFGRDDFTDPARLLACVPEEHRERVGAWRQRVRDSDTLRHLLAPLEPAVHVPPVQRVIDVLNGVDTHRLRSVEDLFALVMEELGAEPDLRDYVELVRTGSKNARAWEHERSLQAFVLLLVRKILRRSLPHRRDVVHREVQEHAGADRPDFVLVRVHPDVGATDSPVELPVEVKWSHNPKCIDDLVGQLGERYVRDKQRTHGIYVVGFSGESPHRDLVALEAALEAKRAAFQAEHREIRLGIVILRFTGS